MPSRKVCLISPQDADDLTLGKEPSCRDHLHISEREARQWLALNYGPIRRAQREVLHMGAAQPSLEMVNLPQRTQGLMVRGRRGLYLVIEFFNAPTTVNRWTTPGQQWVPVAVPIGNKKRPCREVSPGPVRHWKNVNGELVEVTNVG